jgi:hypothetical protein
MHFLYNELKENWIEDYVEGETARARKRVEYAEAVDQQELDDMMYAEILGLRFREPETMFEEMLVAIGDNLSALACPEDVENGEDEDDEETEKGKLREDDKPGWVMGTITKMVQLHMERFWQMQVKLDELTRPQWDDAAHNCGERDKKYGTSELRVLAVV